MASEHARGGGAVGVVREGCVADVEADLLVGVDAHDREEAERQAADVARVLERRRQAEGHADEGAVERVEDLARRQVDAAAHHVARAKLGPEAAPAPPAAMVQVPVVPVVAHLVRVRVRLRDSVRDGEVGWPPSPWSPTEACPSPAVGRRARSGASPARRTRTATAAAAHRHPRSPRPPHPRRLRACARPG